MELRIIDNLDNFPSKLHFFPPTDVYNVNVKSELFKVSRTVNDLNDGMTEGDCCCNLRWINVIVDTWETLPYF